jgi:hypothetical protein
VSSDLLGVSLSFSGGFLAEPTISRMGIRPAFCFSEWKMILPQTVLVQREIAEYFRFLTKKTKNR